MSDTELGETISDESTSSTRLTLPTDDGAPFRISDTADDSRTGSNPDSATLNGKSSATSTSRSTGSSPDLGAAFGGGSVFRSPRANSTTAEQPVVRGTNSAGQNVPASPQEPGVLVSNQTPLITTNIRGPKQILVGREATYQVQLHNAGDVAAEGIVANIRIPSWAEVVATSSTQGMIQQGNDASGGGQLDWQLSRVEARGNETLDIRLIPRASRPLELGVSWTLTPIGSRAVVEVQEPKLQMTVSGPDEVLFSTPQVFRLTLSNPGTGVAENVKIDLMPPGGGENVVTSHPIGDLAPGASKTVEVELTANEAGKLFVKASATAEGGLSSEASKEIFCRKAELEVDWRGPDKKYAGTPATYYFRVRNPGTAPAENVTLHVTLPEGAEFASASEGQSFDAKRREVQWQVGTLGPGDDSYMELKCIAKTPGVNQFRVSAAASSGNLTANKVAETTIIALADLKLQVSDPSGPVAVGEPAVYEIRVSNRGADTAKDVKIVALFAEGIEPEQVEGGGYSVADGGVTFRPIEMPAGKEMVLRIRARANTAGTHLFRAEVLCQDIKLSAEETTRFYADDTPPDGQNSGAQGDTFSQGFEPAAPVTVPVTAPAATPVQSPYAEFEVPN
jgi:uncharacterized repeat protein (TIGR01451 family)